MFFLSFIISNITYFTKTVCYRYYVIGTGKLLNFIVFVVIANNIITVLFLSQFDNSTLLSIKFFFGHCFLVFEKLKNSNLRSIVSKGHLLVIAIMYNFVYL